MRTVVGESETEETGENLAQGSMEASLGSSVNISKGVSDFFSTSEHEVSYGPIKLQPQSSVKTPFLYRWGMTDLKT